MDKTVLTLAVDSTQVGTAAAAFDRMVNAGNAAATTAGKVTSTTLAQGRAIGQTLVPALNRGVDGMRSLADTQKSLGQDATRQAAQQVAATRARAAGPIAPSFVAGSAPAIQSAATGRAAPVALPGVSAGLGQVPGAAASAQAAIDRLTAAARSNRAALVQLTPAADATVRSFRQINATPIKIAAPQGLSAAAAVFAQAQRINPQPLRQVAAAFAATADQAARAAQTVAQANRAVSAAPRGTMAMAGSAPRAPLSAGQIVSSATGQRVPTGSGFSTSEMTIEASRAQSAIERLTNAARNQASALAQVTANASGTADAYRQLAATPGQGGLLGALGGARPAPVGPGSRVPSNAGGQGGNRPQPNGGSGGDQYRPDQLQQLSFQLNDLFVQIASGGSVLTALIQQGSQLSGTFGGVRPAFQAVLNLLTPMRLAAGGAAAAVGVLALAYRDAARDSRAFKDAAVLTGNFAGQTEGQFNALAKNVAGSTQATVASSREIAEALQATGQIGPRAFDLAAEAATRFSQAYGKTAEQTADTFAKMADGPAKFAAEINKSMNLWDASELKALGDMEDAGDIAGAQIAVLDKLNERFRELDKNLDGLDRSLNKGKQAWSAFWDEAKSGINGMLGLSTVEQNITRIGAAIENARGGGAGFASAKSGGMPASRTSAPDLEYQQQDLLAGASVEQALAQNEADRRQANKRAISAQDAIKALVKRAKPESQYKEELSKLERNFRDAEYGGVPVSAADQKVARDQLKKDFTPAKGPKDNSASQILAAQLQTDLRRISDVFEQQRDAFDFQNRFVESAYREGNISLRTLMDQRREVIEGAAKAEIDALDKEAASLGQQLKVEKDPAERIQIKGQIEEVGVRRDRVEMQASRDVTLLNQEEVASYRALNEQVTNYRANLLQLQGDEAGAAALRAQTVIANAKLLAGQAAGTPGAAAVDVEGLERAIAVTDQFNEVQRQASLLAGNSARAEESFALAAEQSGKSLLETERGIYAVRTEELKQLGALAAKAQELADASTDPRIKAYAADLALAYAKAADAIDPALNRLRDANRELAAGIATTAGQAPNAFVQEYSSRRMAASDDIKRQKDEYSRRIDILEGYLATTQDKNDKARLREKIKAEEAKRDGLKGESRGSSALKAINEAVIQPMAEQVFATVNKLLITDPLQKYLEGQLKGLTEGGGMLAGFFSDALGIQADPKDIAQQQQTAAITASSSALEVLRVAAEGAASALNSRSPAGAALANAAPADGEPVVLDPSQPPPVSSELAGASGGATESVSQLGTEALSATSDLARLASAAGVGGSAMAQLPGIIGLFQSAVALMSTSGGGGSGLFGAIASFFGGSGGDYAAAAAATGIFHSGGIVGQPPATRNVSASLFSGAPRYHTGGIVGKAADKAASKLAANEVPAILMGGPKGKREEVLTAEDPRHRDNLGMSIVARIMAESKHEGLKVRGARELGGPVSAGSMYRVNEKGPELLQVAGKQYLMTGAQGGKVLPNEGGGKEARPVVIHNNFALSGPTNHASQSQIAGMAAKGVQRGMRNT